MKLPFTPKQKLQAATRQMTRPMADDYDAEPNMKLSSAFYLVLVLHLLAIGGIFTFSKIKSQQQAPPLDTAYQASPAPEPAPVQAAVAAPKPPEPRKTTGDVVAGIKDSGETYTVAAGDNPVAIARKLHVSYQGLLKLNKIDDPKKLQIGQKLRVPVKKIVKVE